MLGLFSLSGLILDKDMCSVDPCGGVCRLIVLLDLEVRSVALGGGQDYKCSPHEWQSSCLSLLKVSIRVISRSHHAWECGFVLGGGFLDAPFRPHLLCSYRAKS